MLLSLVFESTSPQRVFDEERIFIIEELAADRNRAAHMRLVLGKGAPFEASAPLLLGESSLSCEAKEEVSKLCNFKQAEAALAKRRTAVVGSGNDAVLESLEHDPYFALVLCDRCVQTAPSTEDAIRVLVEVATAIIRNPRALANAAGGPPEPNASVVAATKNSSTASVSGTGTTLSKSSTSGVKDSSSITSSSSVSTDGSGGGGAFGVLMSLVCKYPKLLSESTLYWDDVKTLEKCTGKSINTLQRSTSSVS
jgi:hypothetical protein